MKYPSEVKTEVQAKLEQYHQRALEEALPESIKGKGHDESAYSYLMLGIGGAMTGFLPAMFIDRFPIAMILLTIPLGAGIGIAIAFLLDKSSGRDVSNRINTAQSAYNQYEQDMAKYFQDYCKSFWQAAKAEEARVHNNIQAQKKMGGGIRHPLAHLADTLAQSAKWKIVAIRSNTSDTRITTSMTLSCNESMLRFDTNWFDYTSNNINPIAAGNGEKVAGFAGALAQEICAIDPFLRVSTVKEENRQIVVEFIYDKPNPNYIRPVSI